MGWVNLVTPREAIINTIPAASVTFAPVNLSDSQPPTGLMMEPISGPRKAYCNARPSGAD